MRATEEQVAAFAEKIASLAGAGKIAIFPAGTEIVLDTPYVIGQAGAGNSPHPGYHQPVTQHVHFAVGGDLRRDLPPITDGDKWSERTVAELTRAREVIIEVGWVQGHLMTPDGVCTLGAFGKATGQLTAGVSHRQRVLTAVLKEFLTEVDRTGPVSGIAAWNDDRSRTQDQVLDVLHRCTIWVKGKIDNG